MPQPPSERSCRRDIHNGCRNLHSHVLDVPSAMPMRVSKSDYDARTWREHRVERVVGAAILIADIEAFKRQSSTESADAGSDTCDFFSEVAGTHEHSRQPQAEWAHGTMLCRQLWEGQPREPHHAHWRTAICRHTAPTSELAEHVRRPHPRSAPDSEDAFTPLNRAQIDEQERSPVEKEHDFAKAIQPTCTRTLVMTMLGQGSEERVPPRRFRLRSEPSPTIAREVTLAPAE